VETLENQIKKAPENSPDKKLLEDTLQYIRNTYRSETAKTVAVSPELQKRIVEKAKAMEKIQPIKKDEPIEATLKQVESDG
jgi:hypothetical protein